ncbi:MAG: MFS transporter [Beijerinckiaceae bacterium]
MTQHAVVTSAYPPRRAVVSWMLFDWASQPFFTLVTTFVFAPFFASALASTPAEGQALWGYATGFAGLCIAFLSPVLGAIADQAGSRKPWIALFGSMMVAGSFVLWFTIPGTPLALPIALGGFVLAVIGAEFAALFNNAMMPTLVPPEQIGRLSGTGWAIGYLGGLLSLALTLGFLAASPETGKTLLGFAPAFGLDPATRAGDRFSGPLSALWFIIFVTPMFLFVPDRPRRMALGSAVSSGLSSLAKTLKSLSGKRTLARFLLANMLYADALVALFAFGGIYAAGAFGWGTIEIGIFGILLTVTGVFGAWLGGKLDDHLGSRIVIAVSLVILILTCIGISGTTKDTLLFVFASAIPTPTDGLYATAAEKGYVAMGLLIGLVAGPVQAASRSLLIKLAPQDDIGQYFGLFTLSGKVTSFIGPTLVAIVTQLFMSQRVGVVVLIIMFGLGLFLIMERASEPDHSSEPGSVNR